MCCRILLLTWSFGPPSRIPTLVTRGCQGMVRQLSSLLQWHFPSQQDTYLRVHELQARECSPREHEAYIRVQCPACLCVRARFSNGASSLYVLIWVSFRFPKSESVSSLMWNTRCLGCGLSEAHGDSQKSSIPLSGGLRGSQQTSYGAGPCSGSTQIRGAPKAFPLLGTKEGHGIIL